MSQSLVVNGTTYSYPDVGDQNWGTDATNWAVAVTGGMLQKAGGSFTLTADVDFGANFGLKSIYLKSRAANPSSTGVLRLGNTEAISWRNAGNSANLSLTASASNWLQWQAVDLVDLSTVQTLTNKTITTPTLTMTNGVVTNQLLFPNGSSGTLAWAWSTETNTGMYKSSGGTINWQIGGVGVFQMQAAFLQPQVPLAVPTGTAAAPGLSLGDSGTYLNTGLYSFAANQIGFTTNGVTAGHIDTSQKWTFVGQTLAASGSGAAPGISFSAETNTGWVRSSANNIDFFMAGNSAYRISTSAFTIFSPFLLQAQAGVTITGTTTLDTGLTGVVKASSGVISAASLVNADVSASAAIAFSKLATLTSANILVGNGSNVAASVAMSGDVTITNAGVTAIGAGKIVNAQVNASAAIDYSKLNLTGTILNADINASAAIAGTKISPDFGSQNITTTGKIGVGGAVDTLSMVKVAGNSLSATNQVAFYAPFTTTSGATSSSRGIYIDLNTSAAAYTTTFANCFMGSITAAAGSTITTAIIFDGSSGITATGTITNRAIIADNQAFSGAYALNFSSTNKSKFSGLVGVIQNTNNVTDALPTQAEMVTAFGAANQDTGLIGVIKDANADTNFFICISNGTSWYALKMTKGA